MAEVSAPVKLAQDSLRHYLETGQKIPIPKELPPELANRAGAFVSLKKSGQLRGCIGTFKPTQPNLAAEIIEMAISAGIHDPRFEPVRLDELPDIEFSVDILSAPEKVDSIKELDPQKYGVIVKRGYRSGLLLPALEGVDTVEEQIGIAMQKAGIAPDQEIELFRFFVTRYH
ncbi:MAG: AmmeMemoRadiSam system protein A [Veillonellaceae bacterium]|nr:AmmeMemoRadiSam system protein A [Veillonellaceae bacterium]